MLLSATLTTEELGHLLRSMIPLRIDLSQPGSASRWLDVVELLDSSIEGESLCVAARCRILWPDRTLLDTIEIRQVALVVTPSLVVTDAGVGLGIELRCRALDVRWVPDFVDRRIVDAINERIDEAKLELVWDLSKTLTFDVVEPSARSNLAKFHFDVSTVKLSVDAEGINITGPMTVTVDRLPPHSLEPAAPLSLPAANMLPAANEAPRG